MHFFYVFSIFFSLQWAQAIAERPPQDSVITYSFSGGRLGDNLLTYLHAKWLSYHTEIPLQIKLFNYAQDLRLSDYEIIYNSKSHPENIVTLSPQYPMPDNHKHATYVVPYFPDSKWEFSIRPQLFQVNWTDPIFRKIALEMIAPKSDLNLTLPPKNYISVAIHVREGGTFDPTELQFAAPLKRPPFSFYGKAILEVLKIFKDQPLYFHIFTDASDPKSVIAIIQKDLSPDCPIELHYRTEKNHDRINVLEDFFSLFHYDVLIRPYSNFSMVPEFLHDYAVVITPEHAKTVRKEKGINVLIDKIGVKINQKTYDNLLSPPSALTTKN